MEKVAIYASFKSQSTKSIEYTLKSMTDWCLMKNYDYTIYFDKVKSRVDLNRKELNNLKSNIKNKRYSKVIIKDISQLSKNTFKNIEFLEFLDDNDCQIESIDQFDLNLYKKIFKRYNEKKEERKKYE